MTNTAKLSLKFASPDARNALIRMISSPNQSREVRKINEAWADTIITGLAAEGFRIVPINEPHKT